MSNEELTKLMISGFIAELPEEDQAKVRECKTKLLAIVREYGEVHGSLAIALLGAEAAAGQMEVADVGGR